MGVGDNGRRTRKEGQMYWELAGVEKGSEMSGSKRDKRQHQEKPQIHLWIYGANKPQPRLAGVAEVLIGI